MWYAYVLQFSVCVSYKQKTFKGSSIIDFSNLKNEI